MVDFAEALETGASAIESPQELTRRKLLNKLAKIVVNTNERTGGLPNSDVLSSNELLPYPFKGLDRKKISQSLQEAGKKEEGRVLEDTNRLIGALASGDKPFIDFAYGNPTPYGNAAQSVYQNIRSSFPDTTASDEYVQKELLVAPNLFYFSQPLRQLMFAARDEALKNSKMTIDDLRNGSQLPEEVFNNAIQRRYNEIDRAMRSMRGTQLIFAVVKPSDDSYFQEGPYWKANTTDIASKPGWEIQYIRPVIVGDVKSAFHMYDCTPELTGKRESNFLADLMNGLFSEIGRFRNNNHRPLCMLIKP